MPWSYLMLWPTLSTEGSTSTARRPLDHGRQVELARAALAELVDVGERDVEALAGGHGEADADQLRARQVERGGLGVDGEHAALDRPGDDGIEVGEVGDRGEAELAAAVLVVGGAAGVTTPPAASTRPASERKPFCCRNACRVGPSNGRRRSSSRPSGSGASSARQTRR